MVRHEQFPHIPRVTRAPERQFVGLDGEERRDRQWQPEP
jgi:hypothetical protein